MPLKFLLFSNTYGAINWSELKSLPTMSISNQTEACYLSRDSLNDILICRGDFCLSKIRGDVTDISSCGTTVLELANDSTNENNPSTFINNPYILPLLMIIFTIIILAIVIRIMQRSKNRNTAGNYFGSSRRDHSFSQIETTDKYVENAIRKTIRECYPTANYPAYDKQLFIVESNVRGNLTIMCPNSEITYFL